MQYREMKIRKTYIFASIPSLSGEGWGGGGGREACEACYYNPQSPNFSGDFFFLSFLEIYGSVDKT